MNLAKHKEKWSKHNTNRKIEKIEKIDKNETEKWNKKQDANYQFSKNETPTNSKKSNPK